MHSLPFVVHRAEISQRGVTALWIAEALDVVEHIDRGLIACPGDFPSDALGLERGEEALHRGVRRTLGPMAGKVHSQQLPGRLIEQVTP